MRTIEEGLNGAEDDADQGRNDPALGPWRRYYSEQPGIIICDERGEAMTLVIMAAILFAIGYYIVLKTPLEGTGDDIFLYILRSIFPLIGIACLVFAARAAIRNRKFGVTKFQIQNFTGTLGGKLTGTIRSSVDLHPRGDYTVSLECVEIQLVASDRRKTKHVMRWQERTSVPTAGTSSLQGISVDFNIPAELPPSNRLQSAGHIDWILRIHAPTDGLDYKAAFIVPVFSRHDHY